MKRIIFTWLVLLHTAALVADVVQGRAVDKETGDPLQGVQVSISVDVIGAYVYHTHLTTDSCGVFRWPVQAMSHVNIQLNYFGYESLSKQFNCPGGSKDTLNLGDMKMNMTEELMKELRVTGRAKQFYMKGDTVIFNPEAFNLEKGDRMARLLEKLPGVRITDGQLYFMDKLVHMKMNGRDVADDFLMGQLPADAVQKIKSYEKKSEQAERSGMNDGQEQQVLDIVIKPGFMDKWYGQTKLAAYASKNYRASANLHLLSNKNPIGVYGRVSDCGSITGDVWGEHEWDYNNEKPQRQQFGKIAYRHIWKPSYVESSYFDNWNVSFAPRHLSIRQKSINKAETYIEEQMSSMSTVSTFAEQNAYTSSNIREIPLNLGTSLHLAAHSHLDINITGSATRSESLSESNQQNTRGYATEQASLVNASKSHSRMMSYTNRFAGSANFTQDWNRVTLSLMAQFNYLKERGEGNTHTEYDFHEQGTRDLLDLASNNNGRKFNLTTDANVWIDLLPGKLRFLVGYWTVTENKNTNYDYLRNSNIDLANTYAMQSHYLFNEPRIEVMGEFGRFWMKGWFKLSNMDEQLDYHRGRLDTLAHRNKWYTRPMLEFKLKTSRTTELKGRIQWEYHDPNFLDCMDYLDDTDPLHITMGNPRLRGYSELRTGLSFNSMFTRGQQMLSTSLNYNRDIDPVSNVIFYNPTTGGQLSTKTNTRDRQQWSISANYDRTLGKYWRMRNTTRFERGQTYGVETQTLDWTATKTIEANIGKEFLMSSSSMHESLDFIFTNKGWETKFFGTCTQQRLEYNTQLIPAQRLWEYEMGVKGEYRMKQWNYGLQGRLQGHAGYLSDIMNRNRFALDASVTWRTLKDRAELSLMAKDILNQLDRVDYIISPTKREENWVESFHQYVSLTFTYNFDAKAKKKQK